jgi:putative flippase GtrA
MIVGQFVRYVITGLVSLGVDLLALQLLLVSGVDAFAAVAMAFIAGMVVNLLLHKFFTFRERTPLVPAQVARYLAVVALNLALTEAVVWFATVHFGYGAMVGKLASLPLVLAIGFSLSRLWIFRRAGH